MNGRLDIVDTTRLGRFAAYLADPRSTGAELLLVVAHPDDETTGFGGHLPQLPRTTLVHITDGAPRDLHDARAHGFASAADYAAARGRELAAALELAGMSPPDAIALGIPDQHAVFELVRLTHQLAALFEDQSPDFVLTHPYEGGHPDHDATSFAVAAACWLLARRGRTAPQVIEMASYHLGEESTVYQAFEPSVPAAEIAILLGDEAVSRKQRMLACHATQLVTLTPFSAAVERFRAAPGYDFAALPNGGRLQYEAWGLGLAGPDWLRLAGGALRELELPT